MINVTANNQTATANYCFDSHSKVSALNSYNYFIEYV